MTHYEYTEQLDDALIKRLHKAGCTAGRFTVESSGGSLQLTLRGDKPSLEKPVYFWTWERSFEKLVRDYMDSFEPALWAVAVEIDVLKRQCHYQTTDELGFKQQQLKASQAQETADLNAQQQRRATLASQTTPYGPTLAQAVINRLRSGAQLSYTHRDYCGTGLRFRQECFEYVELWDHGAYSLNTFKSESAFVQWLSQQSDASLALLDAESPFFWGNQTITHQRLNEFVSG